jgi:hypothetical protein
MPNVSRHQDGGLAPDQEDRYSRLILVANSFLRCLDKYRPETAFHFRAAAFGAFDQVMLLVLLQAFLQREFLGTLRALILIFGHGIAPPLIFSRTPSPFTSLPDRIIVGLLFQEVAIQATLTANNMPRHSEMGSRAGSVSKALSLIGLTHKSLDRAVLVLGMDMSWGSIAIGVR